MVSVLTRLSSRNHVAFLVLAAYLLVSLGLFGLLGLTIGFGPTSLAALAFLIGAVVPGATLVRLLLPRAGLLHLIFFGAALGLGLWSLGGLLAHVSGVAVLRWLPAVVALFGWLSPRARTGLRDAVTRMPSPMVSAGALAGLIALIPALRATLVSQPSAWSGWWLHYPDLGFQIAIASEVAHRVPAETPWVAGNPLSYTWTFHSAMGLWSATSSVSSADLVLQAWPVLFAILIPALIAILAWELSRTPAVAMGAPIAYGLVHGLVVSPPAFLQVPLYPVSPTRDFGHIFFVVVLICMVKLLGRRSMRAASIPWLATFLGSVIVATGSKGSELPVLAGAILLAGLVLIVRRRVCSSDFVALAVFAVGAAVGFAITIPDVGSAQSLSWGPMTFLSADSPTRPEEARSIVFMLAVAIAALWITIARWGQSLSASLLAGTMISGLLGLSLLNQTGLSQNYFWQAAEPAVAVASAWCAVILWRRFGVASVAAALAVWLVSTVLRMSIESVSAVTAGILLTAVGAAIFLSRTGETKRLATRLANILVLGLLLTQAAQVVGISPGTTGGQAASAESPGALEASQREALLFIKAHSDVDAIVITNTHCYDGSVADDDCDARHFTVAAFSERRVLLEGWSYTQNGTTDDWIQDQLAISVEFIENPTEQRALNLINRGVQWVYVDTRLPFSSELGDVATLEFESGWARVYRLNG